jgi:predicted ribosome quality control (RQC) complex YloA/Tae2 family protein
LSCSEKPQRVRGEGKEFTQKGEAIYQKYGEIEDILKVVADARSKGFSFAQIWERVSGSGLPQAKVLRSLDVTGRMLVVLDGMELELDSGLAVPQNAKAYYDQAKEMSRKAEGAKVALQRQSSKASKQI